MEPSPQRPYKRIASTSSFALGQIFQHYTPPPGEDLERKGKGKEKAREEANPNGLSWSSFTATEPTPELRKQYIKENRIVGNKKRKADASTVVEISCTPLPPREGEDPSPSAHLSPDGPPMPFPEPNFKQLAKELRISKSVLAVLSNLLPSLQLGNSNPNKYRDPPSSISESLTEHLKLISGALPFPRQTTSDLNSFEEALERRRVLLSTRKEFPSSWSENVGAFDSVVGRLGRIEDRERPLNFDASSDASSSISSLLLTTFPVSSEAMYGAPSTQPISENILEPLPVGTRLAHTTWRIRAFETITIEEGKHRLWMDSVPLAREGGIRSNTRSPFEYYSFLTSMDVWTKLRYQYAQITQASNREWILKSLLPTHFRQVDFDSNTDFEGLLKLGEARMRDCWVWKDVLDNSPLESLDVQAITDCQLAAYLHLHVVDASPHLKFSPSAIFVRQFRGGHDQLFLFCPHPCNIDQLVYPNTTYQSAISGSEKIFFSLLHLAPSLSLIQSQLLDTYIRVVVNEEITEERSFLHGRFDIGRKGQIFLNSGKSGGTIGGIKELRDEELQIGEARAWGSFSIAIQTILDRHLLNPSSASYVPFPTRQLPSLLSDLLIHFASTNVLGMGVRESRVEAFKKRSADELVPGAEDVRDSTYHPNWTPAEDRSILEHIYEQPLFQQRLKAAYGLTDEEMESDHRYRIASARHLASRKTPSYELASYVIKSLTGSDAESEWWWTLHGGDPTFRLQAGFRGTRRGNTVRLRIPSINEDHYLDYREGTACGSCSQKELPSCVIPFQQAAMEGFIEEAVGRDELETIIAILTTEIGKKERGRTEMAKDEISFLVKWAEKLGLDQDNEREEERAVMD